MMSIPPFLTEAIQKNAERFSQKELIRASEELSRLYQNPTSVSLKGDAIHHAYLTVRMPATFAVVSRVLQELNKFNLSIKTLLDSGSGPGTVLWAAEELLPELESAHLIEYNPSFIAIAQQIAHHLPRPLTCQWHQMNILNAFPCQTADLVTASYVIGELPETALFTFLKKSWEATAQAFVIIEPGTPRGYERILLARKWLIEAGAHIAAPCPHHNQCPLAGTERWCHFSQRLQRSSLHRSTKGAALGYEDEKYSYLIATKTVTKNPSARVVGHPRKHSGHLNVDLCTVEGVQQRTFSRRDGPLYKTAQKLSWGDSLSEHDSL